MRSVLTAYAAGDGRQVGRPLRPESIIAATLDLQRISLVGSVFWQQRDLLLPRLQAEVRAHLSALTAGVDLVEAGLGLQVGDYAALALVA